MDFLKVFVGAYGRVPRTVFWITLAILWGGSFIVGASGATLPMIIVWYVIAAWVWLVFCACRARDMGKSGAFGLTTLIPFAGFIFALWLGFSGTKEPTE